MTNRREFLQVAAVASTLPLTIDIARADDVHAQVALHAVLTDSGYAPSRDFGARLAARGAAVRDVPHGDITQLWLRELGPAWAARGPLAIAGLTARPALFCLEQLAWSHGLRVVFHAEHIVHGGAVTHDVLCDARRCGIGGADLERAGAAWPTRIADTVAAHGLAWQWRAARTGPSLAGLEPTMPAGAELLTSWIIAAA